MQRTTKERGAIVYGLAILFCVLVTLGYMIDVALLRLHRFELKKAADLGALTGTLSRLGDAPLSVVQAATDDAFRKSLLGLAPGAVLTSVVVDVDGSSTAPSKIRIDATTANRSRFSGLFSPTNLSNITTATEITTPLINVAMVVDVSDSMNKTDGLPDSRLTRAKSAMHLSTSYLRESVDRVALIKTSWDTFIEVPFQNNYGFNRALLDSSIDALTTLNWTNLGEGVEFARDQFRIGLDPAPPGVEVVNAIVLLTDGAGSGFSFRVDPSLINTNRVLPTRGTDYVYRLSYSSTAISNGLPPEQGRVYLPVPTLDVNWTQLNVVDPYSRSRPSCYDVVNDPITGVPTQYGNGTTDVCPYITSLYAPNWPPSSVFDNCQLNTVRHCDQITGGNCCINGDQINAIKPDGNPLFATPLPLTGPSLYKLSYANDMANADYGRMVEDVRVYTVGFGTADSRYLERLSLDAKCKEHPYPYTHDYWVAIPHCRDLTNIDNSGASMYPDGDLNSLVTAISSTISHLKIKWIL